MSSRIQRNGLQIDPVLFEFIETKALPGSGVAAETFWEKLSELAHGFGPRNAALLAKREEMQAKIDRWHLDRKGQAHDPAAYRAFLEDIGYLLPEGPDFEIETRISYLKVSY